MRAWPFLTFSNTSPEARKKQIENTLRESYVSEKHLPASWKAFLAMHEYQKSHEEVELTEQAITEAAAFSQAYGGHARPLPVERVHIADLSAPNTPREIVAAGKGISFAFAGHVFVDEVYARSQPASFFKTAVHELLHVQSFLSIHATPDDALQRRAGFSLRRHEQPTLFTGVDEALTEIGAQMILQKLRKHDPRISKLSGSNAQRKRYAEQNNYPLHEILWADDENHGGIFTYINARRAVLGVCSVINQHLPHQFQTPHDVLDLFLQAKFNGALLPAARATDAALGAGAFRALSALPTDDEDVRVWSSDFSHRFLC